MTTEEKIKVMQAYVNGQKIEVIIKGAKKWEEVPKGEHLDWDWVRFKYRIVKTTREEMLEELKD